MPILLESGIPNMLKSSHHLLMEVIYSFNNVQCCEVAVFKRDEIPTLSEFTLY